MSGFGDFLGRAGGAGEQLFVWSVLGQVVQSLTLPFMNALSQAMLEADPNVPLDPQTLAQLAARKLIEQDTAAGQASKSGIDGGHFAELVKGNMHAPDTSSVFELWRRGSIDVGGPDPEQASVRGALTDAGIHPTWHQHLLELRDQLPSSAEVLNAWLEGQIGPDEAHRRLRLAGMPEDWISTAYNANGQAPTPVQALELLNRGIIPERGTGPKSTSYEQAFLEGPWRNKWLTAFLALAEYLPPPRTITAMFHDGSLSHARAAELLAKQGLAPDLVAAYLAPTQASKSAPQRDLTKTELVALYRDKLLTKQEAHQALVKLGYSAHEADLELELVDAQLQAAQVRAGTSQVRTLFRGGKLTEPQAIGELVKLGVARDQAKLAVDTWSVTATHQTKDLTTAEVVAAWYYQLLTADDAIAILVGQGFTRFDAWVILSVRNKGALRDVPRPSSPYAPPPPTPPLPTPGH